MAMRYDSRTCTVFQNWEWVQTGTTPITTTTTRKSVTTSQRWKYYLSFDTWAKDGSLSYEGTNFEETVAPPYPGGAGADGAIIYTSGSGMADVTTQSGGEPINGWGASGESTHNASPSISYDDGEYAGTLYRDNVSGSPSAPSYNGSYVGQTDTTSTSGTAYYSGDVSLKDSGGGGSRPSNWTWSSLVSGSSTYELGGVIRADVVSADDWINFCLRINEFRRYKLGAGKDYTFTTAISKTSLTSSHYEEARLAISDMTTVPASVSTGEKGVNSKILALSNALNSIT
jgi:hypothetical protein